MLLCYWGIRNSAFRMFHFWYVKHENEGMGLWEGGDRGRKRELRSDGKKVWLAN